MGHIYLITNQTNSKKYVGYTSKTLKYRWHYHVKSSQDHQIMRPLSCAIRKYGEDNFVMESLWESDNLDLLKELEIYYIKLYHTNVSDGGIGYNLTKGGDGSAGYKWTPEQLKRKSEATRLGWNDPQIREQRLVGLRSQPIRTGKDHHCYGKPNPNAIKGMKSKKAMAKRAKTYRGKTYLEKAMNAKLHPLDVIQIYLQAINKVRPQKDIAILFNISTTQVSMIKNRKQWANITALI